MMTFTPEEEILARGVEDWVSFAEAHGLTKKWARGRGLDVDAETLRVIKTLLESGWMVPGDVTTDRGFVEWPLPPDRSTDEVLRKWRALGRDPMPGDVSWFSNTAEGDQRGEEVLAQYEHGSEKRWIFDDDEMAEGERRGHPNSQDPSGDG